MQQLDFTFAVPLIQEESGTVRVAGSRLTLDVIIQAFKQGASAEQIQDSFPALMLRDVYGVIAYYLSRPNEVEAYLSERQTQATELRQQIESQPQYQEFRARLRARREQLVET